MKGIFRIPAAAKKGTLRCAHLFIGYFSLVIFHNEPIHSFLMKRISRLVPLLGAAALSATIASACSPQSEAAPTDQEVSSALVNDVVLPSYKTLVGATEKLNKALEKLVDDPTSANLDAARAEWKAARKTWERTETWAYGPAETDDFDPNLDDWPVSTKELAEALSEKDFTADKFDDLDTTGRGFHGIEYVLFGGGDKPVEAADLTTQQLAYLKVAGADLEKNAKGLLAAWSGPEGFVKADVEADPAKTVNDILEGMSGCLDEVANGKLGGALEAGKGELESTFSGNTGADVVSNLTGVQVAWEKSRLQALAQDKDSELANQLTEELNSAISKAKALPARLNDKLDDQATREQVKELMAAIMQVVDTTGALQGKLE